MGINKITIKKALLYIAIYIAGGYVLQPIITNSLLRTLVMSSFMILFLNFEYKEVTIPIQKKYYVYAILSGIGLSVLFNFLLIIIIHFSPIPIPVYHNTKLGTNPLFLQLLIGGLLGPMAEEFLFRGGLYTALRKKNISMWTCILITSILFGICHRNIPQGIYATCLGIIFTYSYELTNTIKIPMVIHIAANITSILYGYQNLQPIQYVMVIISSSLIGMSAYHLLMKEGSYENRI